MAEQGEKTVSEHCAEGGSHFGYKIKRQLHEEQTPFQHIAVYETAAFGNLMAIDGFFQLTTRDNFLYHEMLVHPALFLHQNPENVVIIGGGDCGTLREVLKHRTVKAAWQIEIDERVTRLAEQYFPELCEANDDPRATLHFGDGIKWIAEAEPNSLDVVIVDSTDPIGPAKGLFTEEFYKNCHKALKPGGIVVQQSESPMLHRDTIILPMHRAMRSAGFDGTKTLYFPQPCYPLGWWTCTMARKAGDFELSRREEVANKDFKTVYYNLGIHDSAAADPQFMLEALLAEQYSK